MKKKIIFVIIFLLLLINIFPICIYSQEETNTATNTNRGLFQFSTPEKDVETPGYFGMAVKTLLVLGIFGIGIYYIFKFISKKQGLVFPHLNILKIITSIPVGTNRFIQVVEVGNKYYLIGSTESNVNLLSEITDKETLDRIKVLKNKEEKPVNPPTFGGFLNTILGGLSKKIITKDSIKFLKGQKDRIKNLKL